MHTIPFCKGVKIFHFLVKSFLGNFYRLLAFFFWSHWLQINYPSAHVSLHLVYLASGRIVGFDAFQL